MAYLIAAIVMTLSVLEGHSPISSLFKCDSRICGTRSVPLHLQMFFFSQE